MRTIVGDYLKKDRIVRELLEFSTLRTTNKITKKEMTEYLLDL